MLRSALAILAGIVTLTVSSFAIEAVLNPLLEKQLSKDGVMAVTMAYGFLCVLLGGFVTARLAPQSPRKHALWMGLAQAVLTIVAMFSPEGYHATPLQWIFIAALSIPSAWAGGLLRRA